MILVSKHILWVGKIISLSSTFKQKCLCTHSFNGTYDQKEFLSSEKTTYVQISALSTGERTVKTVLMKLQLRHPSILSDQLVATDICHESHREDKPWCAMSLEWQLESSALWKQWGSKNRNNPLSIAEVWWMNTTINLIKLLSFGFCQAAYQIILIFPNLKQQKLCPDGNTSEKKK